MAVLVLGISTGVADDHERVVRFRLRRAGEVARLQGNKAVLEELESFADVLRDVLPRARNAISAQEQLRVLEQAENALGISSVSQLPEPVPRREFLNVAYTNSEGADRSFLTFDAYSPVRGESHPLVVWFHGGGFLGGDKADPLLQTVKPDFFVSRGFVFVSVNYRLAPRRKLPAQAYDAAAAVAFLHDHAEDYGGDPRQIFLIGDSAGGQLASAISTNERFLKRYNKTLDILRGAVILDIGSFDVPSIMDEVGEDASKPRHSAFTDNREDWIAVSPLLHVTPGKSIPPMLLVFVTEREHHLQENRRFAAKLEANGYTAEAYEAKNRTHHTLAYNIGLLGDPPTQKIAEFFEDNRLKNE